MSWSPRKTLLAVFLVAVAVTTWWLPQFVTEEQPPGAVTRENNPNYVISNSRTTVMNADGEPRYTLTAELMQNYPKTNTVRLTKPYLVQYDAGPTPTHAWADMAWLDKNTKVIVMTGNVRIVREKSSFSRGSKTTATQARILLN